MTAHSCLTRAEADRLAPLHMMSVLAALINGQRRRKNAVHANTALSCSWLTGWGSLFLGLLQDMLELLCSQPGLC